MKMDQARRMKELEKENARLRRAVSDLTLDSEAQPMCWEYMGPRAILQEAARGPTGQAQLNF